MPAEENPREKSADFALLMAIRRIIRAADLDSRKLADQHQITAPQLLSLMALVQIGKPSTSIDISRLVQVSASTMVGILERLEAKGLITRTRDTVDRRQVFITPTRAGKRVVQSTPFPLQDVLEKALSKMPADKQEQVVANMQYLADLMAIEDVSAGPMLEILSISGKLDKDE